MGIINETHDLFLYYNIIHQTKKIEPKQILSRLG